MSARTDFYKFSSPEVKTLNDLCKVMTTDYVVSKKAYPLPEHLH